MIRVVGETSGGAPFGTSLEDFRLQNERGAGESGWVRAKRALRTAFESTSPPGTRIEVDFVEPIGRGTSRDAFGTSVYISPDPAHRSDAYVALIPNGTEGDYGERVQREADVLRWIPERLPDLRAPRVVALIDDRGAPILVESFVGGVVVDLRAGRQLIHPWGVVAEAAAAIHAVPPPPTLPTRTQREHRLEIIEALERREARHAVVDDALAWMREHPGDLTSGVLVHGDLLGHNLRIHPGAPMGVIDWHEVAVGDPAAELAIVTRGVRQPFQVADGHRRLLDTYNERASSEVSGESLRFFELALLARWVVESDGDLHRDDAWLRQIERMLRSNFA